MCATLGDNLRPMFESNFSIAMLNFVFFTPYANSLLSCIHVNTTKFDYITCTLVATGVILRRLECNTNNIKLDKFSNLRSE